MVVEDDRTEDETTTHPYLVIGTDRVLSGWGKAEDGLSYAVWACRPEDRKHVLEWVEQRGDMMRVRETVGTYRPSGCGHCHIYVVRSGHPSLASKERMEALHE